MHEFGVLIGRFQPFHDAHLSLVRFAFENAERLIIVIGSSNQALDTRDPWSEHDRERMIMACLSGAEKERVTFIHAEDYLYNNLLWIAAVQKDIDEVTGGSRDIKLIGHRKDASSFYLNLFPQWGEFIEHGVTMPIDATKIRELLFEQDKIGIKPLVPAPVYDFLVEYMGTDEYQRLHEEHHDVLADKAAWVGAPYQPVFNTTDAVVICSGHVLVVRRRGKYGRGLIALPGGYIKASELMIDGCVRELKEETGIRVDAKVLKERVVDSDVFDHPRRDLRGRVITRAYCIKLPDGELPKVKGNDDADKSWWMSVNDVNVNKRMFFSDHVHIIRRFVNRY